jgi:signal transduction histidine kinase
MGTVSILGEKTQPHAETIAFGPYVLCRSRKVLREGNRPIPLGTRALSILIALVDRAGTVVSQQELMRCAWPNTIAAASTLRMYLSEIRKGLRDECRSARYIDTLIGRGYSFIAEVTRIDADGQPSFQARRPLPATVTPIAERDREMGAVVPSSDTSSYGALLRAKLQGRLEERERIARELHDTLLQSAQGLILTFDSLAGQLAPSDPRREIVKATVNQASELLDEARALISGLRSSSHPPDITDLIGQTAKHLSLLGHSTVFGLKVRGTPRRLQLATTREIVGIAREALTNAFKHSLASSVTAEITFTRDFLKLRVCDNGKGINPSLLGRGLEWSHFGLRGMRERAQQMGAQLDITSREGAGTEVRCIVRGSVAFARMPLARQSIGEHGVDLSNDIGRHPFEPRMLHNQIGCEDGVPMIRRDHVNEQLMPA